MACPAHASLPIGTPNRRRVISPSSSLTRRAGGDRMDWPQSEGDGTSGNGLSEGIRPTGWRAWNLEQVLVLGGFVSMLVAVLILVTADPTLVVVLVVLLAPGILFTALLLWRARPWTYLIAGVANCLLGIVALPIGLLGALGNPLVGPVYSSVVLATLSILLALPAGIIGDLRGRKILRQRTLAEGIYGLQGFAAIALVAVSIGAMASGALAYQNLLAPVPMTGPFYDIPASANVSILVENSRFVPSAFNTTAFNTTRITILNEDDAPHTFTYVNNGTTYSHYLPGGSTTRFFVLFLGPGTVPFWSIPDRSGGMVGNITVSSA